MLTPLLLLLAAAATPATTARPHGLWQGNVGDLPVRACFTRREQGPFGAYYYLSRGRLIALEAEGAGGSFRENGGTDPGRPQWTIERVEGARLTARWTGGGRTLPIRLSRIAGTEREESPCSDPLFHRPRLAAVRTVTARATVDGISFTRISLDPRGRFEATLTTFALDGTSEAVRRINAAAGQALAGDPPQWLECMRTALEQGPYEGEFDESLEPTLISRRWLGVAHHWDGFCGGAHPDASNAYRTFDLASGREIDLHDWFRANAVQRERPEGSEQEIKSLQPAFRDAILAGWRSDPADCDEIVRSEAFWTIGLTRDGLVFSPDLPHAAQACGEEFRLPLARLLPFLTEEGAANLRALQGEAAPARQPAP